MAHSIKHGESLHEAYSTLAVYDVPGRHKFRLQLCKGSILDFSYPSNPERAAIVVSDYGFAGGLAGAVDDAGGPNLYEDRKSAGPRAEEGKAVIVGPNNYGNLKVSFVIYASAGYSGKTVSSAYASSLERGKSRNLEAIAFSLLGAGQGRGEGGRYNSVLMGVRAVRQFEGYSNIKTVYMYAFSAGDEEMLLKSTKQVFATPMHALPGSFAKSISLSIGSKLLQTGKGKQTANEDDESTNEPQQPQENSAFSTLATYKISGSNQCHLVIAKGSITRAPSRP